VDLLVAVASCLKVCYRKSSASSVFLVTYDPESLCQGRQHRMLVGRMVMQPFIQVHLL
jgi:hypothetical protein